MFAAETPTQVHQGNERNRKDRTAWWPKIVNVILDQLELVNVAVGNMEQLLGWTQPGNVISV